MRINRLTFILVFAASVFVGTAQTPLVNRNKVPEQRGPMKLDFPNGIILPEGYSHERLQGIDSQPGRIKRDDGFTISYDIGRMAGLRAYQYFTAYFEAQRKQTHLNTETIESHIARLDGSVNWRKEEDIDGEKIMIVLLNTGKIIASFPGSYANFFADADSSEKIDAFLKIVTTYRSPVKKVD